VNVELDQLPARLDADLLAVDEALTRFAAVDPTGAELVKLRYFAGLTVPEAAAALGMSPRSADRLWAYVRAWFQRELSRDAEG
jgi:DNA-directed RNA polymerase specialized sigma24 family protein